MVNYCLVPGCSIRTREGQVVSFHHLPARDVERCKQWLRAINHRFSISSRKTSNLMSWNEENRLKDTAIPSIFTFPDVPSGSKRTKRVMN
uniref:THAP domain-containing protein 1 n=1 Tax=Labrus bergylta TaxID=56723 RepID=A0A3Q3F5R6_9LABR